MPPCAASPAPGGASHGGGRERAGTVARQALARGIAGAPGSRPHGTLEAAGFPVACLDNGIEAAARIRGGHVVVEARGKAAPVVAMRPLDMAP